MANRNRRYRNEDRMDRDYEGTLRPQGQQEQFQEDRFESNYDRGYGQMGDDMGGYAEYEETMVITRPRYRGQDRDRGRYGETRQRNQGETYGEGEYNYGAARYDNGQRRSFGSFTTEDQGGRDFAGPRQRYQGAGYAGSYGYEGRNEYARGIDGRYANERGFFEKAGDEIASWFGDEDAERRREMDHRGRGPANYTRSDERILEDACDCLTQDRRTNASNVTVTVSSGEVTLDGTVPSRMQKRRAEDVVHDISGVKHVQNNLRVDEASSTYETTQTEKL